MQRRFYGLPNEVLSACFCNEVFIDLCYCFKWKQYDTNIYLL